MKLPFLLVLIFVKEDQSVIEYLEHIKDELDYLLQKSQGLYFDTFYEDETLKMNSKN